jgi:hypothetical protein
MDHQSSAPDTAPISVVPDTMSPRRWTAPIVTPARIEMVTGASAWDVDGSLSMVS